MRLMHLGHPSPELNAQGPETLTSTKVRIYGCNLHLSIHHRVERLANRGDTSMCKTKWLKGFASINL